VRPSAFSYDWTLWWAKRAGNADRRGDILATAHGHVLELGAGTESIYTPAAGALGPAEPVKRA